MLKDGPEVFPFLLLISKRKKHNIFEHSLTDGNILLHISNFFALHCCSLFESLVGWVYVSAFVAGSLFCYTAQKNSAARLLGVRRAASFLMTHSFILPLAR